MARDSGSLSRFVRFLSPNIVQACLSIAQMVEHVKLSLGMAKAQPGHTSGLITLLACLAPFMGFWSYGLFDLDEGYYGAVVGDMLRRGNWITPTLNGIPWFEKPILSYWLAMPSVALFGPTVGPRLPSVLCTLATIFIGYRFASRHFGKVAGQLTALLYSGSLLVIGLGRMMMTDAPLNLCLVVATTTFYESLIGDQRKRLYTALFLGLAVLAKGPVALILFAGIAAITLVKIPPVRGSASRYWVLGTVIVALVIAAWYLPCYQANGQSFIQKFLVEQNVNRFAGGDKAHAVPFYLAPIYYPIILGLALVPGLLWGARCLNANPVLLNPKEAQVRKFLLIWAGVIMVFFTLSGTKLPHYILPAVFPAVIFLVSSILGQRGSEGVKRLLAPAALWCFAIWPVAQMTFVQIYETQFEEVQNLASSLRDKPGTVVSFAMGRRNTDVKLSLDLQETSHPSLSFYLGRPLLETDDIDKVGQQTGTVYLLTRAGRIDFVERASVLAHNRYFESVKTVTVQKEYRLYELKVVPKPGH